VLLGNADVDESAGVLHAAVLCESEHRGRAGRDRAHRRIPVHLLHEVLRGEVAVILSAALELGFAGFNVERHVPVPAFLVLYRRSVAASLFGDDVDNYLLCGILDLAECSDELVDVVAVLYEDVIQVHCAEEVAFSLSVGFAQELQVLVKSAVVLGDGHSVVVHNDDEIAAELAGKIQTLEGFAAGEGAIADDRDHIALSAVEVTTFGGGGSVPDSEVIVGTFMLAGVSGHIVVLALVQEGFLSAGEHFVAVALVGYVEHHLVRRGIENVVQCDDRLCHAEVRSAVSSVDTKLFNKCSAHFSGERSHLVGGELLHVRRGVDLFKIHLSYLHFLFYE